MSPRSQTHLFEWVSSPSRIWLCKCKNIFFGNCSVFYSGLNTNQIRKRLFGLKCKLSFSPSFLTLYHLALPDPRASPDVFVSLYSFSASSFDFPQLESNSVFSAVLYLLHIRSSVSWCTAFPYFLSAGTYHIAVSALSVLRYHLQLKLVFIPLRWLAQNALLPL